MQRYFVNPEKMSQSQVIITGDDVKHITKVMRLQIGDKIVCLNNKGKQSLCRLKSIHKEEIVAEIDEDIESNPELPVKVTIAQALIKGDKLDLVIQKGTELGATSFYLFDAERSVVKWDNKKVRKKLERLEKIAKEAAEQSGRLYIPQVLYFANSQDLFENASFDAKMFLFEETAKQKKHDTLASVLEREPATLLAVIGPEGGFSEEEAFLYKRLQTDSVSLGPRILRSETAPLYLLSAVSYHYELMR